MHRKKKSGHKIDAEIFSTGKWNGDEFDMKDLEEIAANFKLLKDQLKPPLKFGHDENQTLLGQNDGDPALGWVTRIRVSGDKLVATFSDVPTLVYRAIKAKRYRRVSAEIYFNVRREGKILGKALKAVALLGADLPAVTNLEDLAAFLTDRPDQELQVGTYGVYALDCTAAGVIPIYKENGNMSDHQNHQSSPKEPSGAAAFSAGPDQEREGSRAGPRELSYRSTREEALLFCQSQVGAGRIPPFLHQRLVKEIDAQARSFTARAGLSVSFGWLREFILDFPPRLPQGEVGFSRDESPMEQDETDNPSLALSRQAAAKMTEMKLSYSQAAEYVLKTNPALAKAYRDYTINPTKGG